MSKKSVSPTQTIRRLVQLAFAAIILFTAVRQHLSAESGAVPSTDALCPFGGLETLWSLLTSGTYCPKTHPSNVVLGLSLLAGTLLAGGAFCGWVCPLGSLQDLLTAFRQKLRWPEVRPSAKLDRFLSLGRFIVLGGILYATASTAKLWFAGYDPYRTIFGLEWLFSFNLAEQWPALAASLAVLIGSFWIPRLWCRYLCPLGGVISLVSRASLFRIRRDSKTCIDCKKCDRTCPVKITVSNKGSVTAECIGCLQCVEACPVPGALYTTTVVERVAAAPKES